MIHVLGCFQTKADHRDGVRTALLGVRNGSPAEEGCLGIRLFEDRNDTSLFFGDERFVDGDAVEYHRAQPYEIALTEVAETGLLVPPVALILDDAIDGDSSGEVSRSAEPDELVAIAVFDFEPGQREVIIAQYERQIPNVRAHKSCIAFNAFPVIGEPSKLVVMEWWTSPEAAREFSTTDPLSIETGELLSASLDQPVPEYLHELQEMRPDEIAT